MYTLSRYLQTIAYRRLSDRQLRAEARGAQERLEEIEADGLVAHAAPVPLHHQPRQAGMEEVAAPHAASRRRLGEPLRHAVKLAMTLIVRNEADVIEDNLRFHRAQGVDFFIALDNGSTDGTVEILERHEQAGVLKLVRMPGPMLTGAEAGSDRDRPPRTRDGRRLGGPQRRRRVLVAAERQPQGGAGPSPRAVRHRPGAPDRVHRPSGRPGLVRRANGDPGGPLPATAEDRTPRPPADQDVGAPPHRYLGEERQVTPKRPGRKARPAHRVEPQGRPRPRAGDGARVPDRGPALPASLLRAVPKEGRSRGAEPALRPQRRRAGAS